MTFGGAFVPTFSSVFDRGGVKPDLLTGLVAYWPLNEASGNALDAHTGGKTLTQSGTVGNSTGLVYPTARTFNSGHFARTDSALMGGAADYTIATWVYLTSKSRGCFAVSRADNNNIALWDYDISYQNAPDRFAFRISNGSTLTLVPADALGSPSLNTWYFIVAWHVVATKTIYISVNNEAPDSTTYTGTHAAPSVPFHVGTINDLTVLRWLGRVGPTAFWNGQLDSAKRTWLYNGGSGRKYTEF